MLSITIPAQELYDEEKEEFVTIGKDKIIQLEHSLVSISKWESKWKKSFLSTIEKNDEETLDYIKCMTITQNIDESVYSIIASSKEIISRINNYLNDPMTATIINNKQSKASREIITSEVIYYWMISHNIPLKCEQWHINRLLTLIQICDIKNNPPKKMSKRELLNRNRALNEARKQKYNTKG